MRTLIVTEFISLDGVVDSPGGGDHPHAGWTFKDVEFDEAAYEIKGREQAEAGAMLIGRQSYDEFAPVWPTMEEFAEYNAMPKYVVSTTLRDPEWNNTTVLRSLDEVAELKKGDGGTILVHGSATLAQNLAAAGLVDRYHLLVFPVRPRQRQATLRRRRCRQAASSWSSTRRTPTASSWPSTTSSADSSLGQQVEVRRRVDAGDLGLVVALPHPPVAGRWGVADAAYPEATVEVVGELEAGLEVGVGVDDHPLAGAFLDDVDEGPDLAQQVLRGGGSAQLPSSSRSIAGGMVRAGADSSTDTKCSACGVPGEQSVK